MAEELTGLPCPESGERRPDTGEQTASANMQAQSQKPKAASVESKSQVLSRLLFRIVLACAILAGLLTIGGIAISSFQADREKSSSPA